MLVIPVMFWSCLARLVTRPAATGSMVATNTTGVRPAASLAGSTDGVPEATRTSSLRVTNSIATSGICAALFARPYSMTKCFPSIRSRSRIPWRKPSMNAGGGGPTRRKPTRRIEFGCCALTVSDQAVAAPPRIAMNFRRLMQPPQVGTKRSTRSC
jgi:hypothetical protein